MMTGKQLFISKSGLVGHSLNLHLNNKKGKKDNITRVRMSPVLFYLPLYYLYVLYLFSGNILVLNAYGEYGEPDRLFFDLIRQNNFLTSKTR